MTSQKKIIIIGSSILAIVLLISGILIFANPTPKPTSEAPNQDIAPTEQEDTPVEHAHDHGTDAVGEPLSKEQETEIKKNATQAAQAFVTQIKNETPEARATRLSEFFSPGSPALTAPAPIADPTYSTAQVTVIESGWYDLGNENAIGIIVYLDVAVDTGFGDYQEYQTWVVESSLYENAWLARNVTKSDLPYIEGVN